MKQNIGIKVKAPKEDCKEEDCPFHGNLKCRGRTFVGTVISSKMSKTCTIEWVWKKFIQKYERFESRRTKVKAHNPKCIDAKEGDVVKIVGCRPLSKTKNFVIIEVLGKEKGFKEKVEAREESKVKTKKKEEDLEE